MSFYKQISVIALFFTIQILFFIPNYNNLLIITLKGLVSGGLVVILFSYGFPGVLKNYTKRKNNLTEKRDNKENNDYRIIDKKYKTLLSQIQEGIISTNNNYITGIYIYDQSSAEYTLKSSSGDCFTDTLNDQNALLLDIISNEQSQTYNKKGNDYSGWDELIDKTNWTGSESLMGFPIRYQNNAIGALVVYIEHFSNMNAQDQSIINSLVNILNQGIDDIEESEVAIRSQINSNRIIDLFKDFDPEAGLETFLKSIKNVCRAIFKYDKLTISFASEKIDQLKVMLIDGFDEDIEVGISYASRNSIIGLSFIDNKTIHYADWRNEFPEMNRFDADSKDFIEFSTILSAPLREDGRSIGNISFERMGSYPFSDQEIEMLNMLSENVSKILGWIDIHQELNRSASRDGLTGLLNHKTFLSRFEKEITRSSRFDHQLGLIFFDIDKFKLVNDNYGHLYGDYVLEEVSRIITKNVRSIDIVGRYGGEEFSVLLVNTDINACIPLAEKIVKKLAKKTFLKDGIAVNLTISAGMAGFPLHSDNVEALIAKADKAMYQTKQIGGNGVTIAE